MINHFDDPKELKSRLQKSELAQVVVCVLVM
ncbi:MAG: hypothetical protein RIR96_914 [Bacteroidota bacterium]